MRGPSLVFVVLSAGVLGVMACEKPTGPVPSAAGSGSSSSSSGSAASGGAGSAAIATNLPHDYGDLTDAEIAHAIDEEYVIAMVRVGSFVPEGQGTKSAAIRYEVDLLQPLLGTPPSNVLQYGEQPTLAVGRIYAMIVNRKWLRALVRAVEIPEDKYKDVGHTLAERIDKASAVAAAASASAAAAAASASASAPKPAASSAAPKASGAPTSKPSSAAAAPSASIKK